MPVDFSKIPSPCFVIDEALLEKNLKLIKSVKQRAGIDIIMAFKGFAMWSVFPIVKQYIGSTTASSLNEALLAFEEFGTPAHTYAPVYSDNDFPEIVRCSSHITFNSLTQFEHFQPFIKKVEKRISQGLRVNPEFSEVETELYNPCAPGSRLGVIALQLPETLPAEIEGLHFHTLCESKSFDLEKTLKAFEAKFGKYFDQIKWVNMGGGHLMTHKDYDVEHLINLLVDFKQRTGLEVILEPGSAFAWQTGYLISTVLDIVENKGIKTAMLDVSFAAHMPDCLEMPYKPKIIGSHFDPIDGKPTYRMGGNSCLSGDYVGFWSFDKELQIGDKIIFDDMIHYTMVKTTFFNGVKHPSIGKWNETKGFTLVREFDYNDYKNKLS
ncbi:MAG TPA: carboxynorspermidine decarboxylase [Prolixibacteraceae bacterium]|nr:carboxynorspermidine decarboxylase [Prolixibacteraceae bacterium]HPR59420.1 carboxynorspermidine decarboxylase [Prolixibacteraceae bacterium]